MKATKLHLAKSRGKKIQKRVQEPRYGWRQYYNPPGEMKEQDTPYGKMNLPILPDSQYYYSRGGFMFIGTKPEN